MLDAKKCLEIYEFCQAQYGKLEKKEGHYNPKHDNIVMEQAASKFKMSVTTINKAFDLAANTYKKCKEVECTERVIRNKLNMGTI